VALTGEKLNGADMIALGLATHYSMSEVRYSFANNMF
jgi:3-hydroxyisobutyryl-CoA hydrolase